MSKNIGERGKAGGFTLDGEPNDIVHFVYDMDTPEGVKIEAICRSGAYHILYTRDWKAVTCKYCQAKVEDFTG